VATRTSSPRLANGGLPGQFERYFVGEKARVIVEPLQSNFDREPVVFARSQRICDALSFDLRAQEPARQDSVVARMGGRRDHGHFVDRLLRGGVKFMGGLKATEDFFRLFLIVGFQNLWTLA
jgi:hypothetical protein